MTNLILFFWLLSLFFISFFYLSCDQKHTDEVKDFFKSFQKSFRRKKKDIPQKTRKESLAPTQVGGQGFNLLSPSNISNRNKSKTWSTNRHSPPPVRATGTRGENHPGRRFTVTEDLRSAWTRGGHGGVPGSNREDAPVSNRRSFHSNTDRKQ